MSYQLRKWNRIGVYTLVPILSLSLIGASAYAAESKTTQEETVVQEDSQTGHSVSQSEVPDPEQAEISKDEAVEKVRKLLPDLEKAEVNRVELRNPTTVSANSEERIVWNIQWNYREENTTFGFSSEVDAVTGDILRANAHGPLVPSDSHYPPEMTEAEAIKKAKEVIDEAISSINTKDLELENSQLYNDQSLFGTTAYSFRFTALIDGVPAVEQRVTLELTGDGKVTRFHSDISDKDYPSSEPEVTQAEAMTKFKENLPLQKSYFSVRQPGGEKEIFLGWQPDPNNTSMYLDAKTNEYLGMDGSPLDTDESAFEEMDGEESFSPIDPADGETISAEQAASVVNDIISIGEEAELNNTSLRENTPNNNRKVWELNWQTDSNSMEDIRATVDAKTGQIVAINKFHRPLSTPAGEQGSGEKTLSEDELKEKAKDSVLALFPDADSQLKLMSNTSLLTGNLNGQTRFQFQRFVDGVPVQNDYVYLRLDNKGEINNYRMSITSDLDEKIDGLSTEIDEAEAKTEYVDRLNTELQYYSFRQATAATQNSKSTTKLIYSRQLGDEATRGTVLDANTGEWRTQSSLSINQQNQSNPEPIDVEGHFAEEALNILLEYNILSVDSDKKVNPDQSITYGDWLEMMARAVSPNLNMTMTQNDEAYKNISSDNEYFEAVLFAANQGWLNEEKDEINVDQTLTKDQLIESAVQIMGYHKLAGYMGEHLPFEDTEAISNKGAVEIALQLEIVDGEENSFSPEQEITKANAATSMMKLVDLQGNIDQEISNDRRY